VTAAWTLPQGTFTSDRPFVFTDDFPPPGAFEFDLQGRGYVRFTLQPAYRAHEAFAVIGLRGGANSPFA
jgi:hypothetical protein